MAIGLITTLPTFISPEEHKNISASTPASFADIPPVLRHKQENVSVTLDPPLQGFSSEDGKSGTLYVIERCVSPLIAHTHILSHALVPSSSCPPQDAASKSTTLPSLSMPSRAQRPARPSTANWMSLPQPMPR